VLLQQIIQGGPDLAASSRAIVQPIETAGGMVDVLFEVLRPAHALSVVGINDASLALAHVATRLGWKILLVDHLRRHT